MIVFQLFAQMLIHPLLQLFLNGHPQLSDISVGLPSDGGKPCGAVLLDEQVIQHLLLQKEVLYYLFVKQYSTTRLAAIRGQSDRNIRKLRMTIQKKLQKRMYEHLSEKLENDHSFTLREREFMEEYEALLQTMGKDAVIRRENKTKPRKKKAALDDAKDG